MRPPPPLAPRLAGRVLAAAALFFLAPVLLFADVVVRRDGSTLSGRVVSVTADAVLLEAEGTSLRIPRRDVAEIRFEETKPVRVEIRNLRSDDALDVLLEDEIVMRESREGGEWIDLTPRLKEGNNALTFRIHNARGTWAYRVALRLNGDTTILACGTPLRGDAPCREHGHTGLETGRIDLPPLWIHVDRGLGRVEVLR